MVKKTINFHDVSILDEFDKKIISEFGSVRGYRTKMLEKIMKEYSSGIYEENNKKLEQLKHQVSEMSSEYETLVTVNAKLKEENKKYPDNIDKLTKEIESLQNKYDTLAQDNQHLQQLLLEKENRIMEHKATIGKLQNENNGLNKKVTSKENEYKHLEEIRNKDLKEKDMLHNKIGKYSYVIGYIENMSLLDRIRKNYPDEMKALPEYNK